MAWTAEILSTGLKPDNAMVVQAEVRFRNDATGEEFVKTTFGDDLDIGKVRSWARLVVNSLVSRDTAVDALKPHIGPLDLALSAAEVELQGFVDKLTAASQLRRQASVGVIDANSAALADADAELKAAWKPEYAGKTPAG